MERRDFLYWTGSTLALAVPVFGRPTDLIGSVTRIPVEDKKKLADAALEKARSAGASYADVRVARNRSQSVTTREQQITGLADNETMGIGIRVIAGGSWGFVATNLLTADDVAGAARRAVAQARANAVAQLRPVELAPAEVHRDGQWSSPIGIDPFEIAIEDKVSLLFAAITRPAALSSIFGLSSPVVAISVSLSRSSTGSRGSRIMSHPASRARWELSHSSPNLLMPDMWKESVMTSPL